MDSVVITEEHENPDNVDRINKEASYSTNAENFSQDIFAENPAITPDDFHDSNNIYQLQNQPESVYNPEVPVQHLQYENQGQHNIETISAQTYYSTQEAPFTSTYVSEQSQDSTIVHVNNGQTDGNNTEHYTVDNPDNSNATDYNNAGIVQDCTTVDGTFPQQGSAESNTGDSLKMDDSNVSEVISNSEKSSIDETPENITLESENETINEQPCVDQNTEKNTEDNGVNKKENDSIIANDEHTEVDAKVTETDVKKADVKKTSSDGDIVVEQSLEDTSSKEENNEEQAQFTDLQNYQPQPDEYTFVEEESFTEQGTSKEDNEQPEQPDEMEASDILKDEEQNESQTDTSLKTDKGKKPRRTRKPIFEVPMHLLGHDINKPIEQIQNGRPLPRPRLGVKLPCRNLTSQIVSKAEIEQVILERARAKEAKDASQKSSNKFTKSMTERLTSKMLGKNVKEESKNKQSNTKATKDDESKIKNDDDLLAILEGDDDELSTVSRETSNEIDDTNIKLLEREIALQQLQELPLQEPKERIQKPRFPTVNRTSYKRDTPPKLKSENTTPKKVSTPKSVSSVQKKSEIDLDLPPVLKKQVDVEPQVRVNMVLKTYSRKRKPSDVPEFEVTPLKRLSFDDTDLQVDDSPKSDPLAVQNVYMTKSSRVIKKKVIWDPDDDQTSKITKPTVTKIDSTKILQPKIVKSSPIVEKKVVEKPAEKPKQEQKPVKSPEKSTEKAVIKKVVTKKSPVNKPKRALSEIDKLLMDEGAVKMLYDLKGEANSEKRKRHIYSVEKAEKDIQKKANLLKNDLVQNTSTESMKTLRKKDSPLISPARTLPVLERKMSKDSTRSSVHTPPRSPTMFSSQASMLIRRRSSSSVSSDDELSSKKSSKPKKQKKISTSTEEAKEEANASIKDIPKPVKGAQYKSFAMKRCGKHVSIVLNYVDDYCYFTTEVLEELIAALKKLEKDKECVVVSVTSTSTAFCLGLDYSTLVSDDSTERIDKAKKLAVLVRDLFFNILNFPKILIAGIQGKCEGLGVTMLTLFDSVIASDTATFSTPYAQLGCLGEATFLLSYPNLSNNGLAAELLYANQTLKADEACRRGLISKLCWPEKYKETLKTFLFSISKGSKQSLESTKRQLRVNLKKEIEETLEAEMDTLVEHWTSSECQARFSEIAK
ncbi:unnamed protein product [Phyllotreta striolata]|uniref:Uncharacterized protein n=1 Tax=Phyllotreta striolata TaxID=444603 RepID=A0A9N9TQZ7_PHYSR|nr:unnamed protein product [Phyllotreta striolata]